MSWDDMNPGDLVVCVDDREDAYKQPGGRYRSSLDGLTKDRIYTVRDVLRVNVPGTNNHVYPAGGIYLEEIVRRNIPGTAIEAPFARGRFRPCRKTDISVFTALLAPVPVETEAA